MQEEALSEDDLRLIDALQVWPRAPWSQLGPILKADPVTLARRWARLQERGMAWVTVQQQSGHLYGGIVEISCLAGEMEEVIAALVDDTECLSIDVTSGARDLVLTVSCASITAFGRYATERLNHLPGVRSVRTQPAIRPIAVGSQWRLRVLDPAAAAALEGSAAGSNPRPPEGRRVLVDPEIAQLLSVDGRVTTHAVADALDIPLRKARERLASTLASDQMRLRTDMPREVSGWPVAAWFFVRVPAAQVADVGTRLSSLRAVRTILLVAGPANVLINVWLRDLADVEQLEESIEQQLPGVRVLDRSLVMGVRKRMGRVFDREERPLRMVPWTQG